MRTLTAGVILLTLALLVGVSRAEDASRPPIGSKVGPLAFKDIRALPRTLDDLHPRQVVVLVATSTTCPLAARYLPTLAKWEQDYRDRGVRFVALNVSPLDSIPEMATQAIESGAEFPFVKDIDGTSIASLGLTRTPEAVVLDSDDRIRYRGRIDDRHRLGGSRPEATREELKEAIEAVLEGREVTISETPVDGCRIASQSTLKPADTAPPTYAEQVAPILKQHCQECHRPNTEAPFSLTSYRDAAAHAATIAEVVADRRMPPWYASESHGSFINRRALTAEERETLARWADAGTPRGDPSMEPEPLPPRPSGWMIDEPDLVVTMPLAHSLPADGDLAYRYAVFPHVFLQDTWVQSIEILPDNLRVVHHANLAYIQAGERPSTENFLTGRVPGGEPLQLDDGMAVLIPSGSVLVLQIHYVTTGRLERSRISIGLRFPRQRVEKRLYHSQVTTGRFSIPPQAPAHPVSARRTVAFDATGVGLFAHMHLRGRDATFRAIRPDGSDETLLLIPNYSFDWQHPYRFEPGRVRFPAGTHLETLAHYDNSAFNPFNPDPDATVRYGDQTHDEMMFGFFFYTRDDENLNLRVDPKTGREVAP